MIDRRPTARAFFSRRRTAAGAALLILLALGGLFLGFHQPARRAARLLREARAARLAENLPDAERAAAAALKLDPALAEAALLAAECAVAGGSFERALAYVEEATPADPHLKARTALFAARLQHHRLHRLSRAERAYRAVLALEPDQVDANTALAQVLGLCGRGREAVPYVLRLVRLGEISDLLVLLARPDGAIQDPAALEAAHRSAPDDPNPLVGLAWQAASQEHTDEAIGLLRRAIALEPHLAAAHVALGRQLLAARRFDELLPWNDRLPPGADDAADTWLVRARMAEEAQEIPAAIRCYAEAARRSPESKQANFRLAHLLAETGAGEASGRFVEHGRRLRELEEAQNRVLFSNDDEGIGPLIELVRRYEAAGRLWEAWGWCQMAVRFDPSNETAQRLLKSLEHEVEGLPLLLTADAANPALALDFTNYPLPRFHKLSTAAVVAGPSEAVPLSFRDDSGSAGLHFRYFNGAGDSPGHRMYEFTGGGIAVLDFDLDGWPDVYFTQGCAWPPDANAAGDGDRLFRNRSGTFFDDATAGAGLRGGGFGQGVAVGDFNADGFPDLYAAHLRANQLWRNNGDGTFSDVTSDAGVAGGRDDWTTSCLIADLDGDALPDIYAVNYVTGSDVFDRVCRHPDGAPRICMPFDFEGQPDRLWLNQGDGRFLPAPSDVFAPDEPGKGLGVAAFDSHLTGRLSLLVANDTTPNFFFVSDALEGERPRLRNRGIESGLALSGEGKAKAGMGIALGDVNGDGWLDVHVTNFFGEANSLYLSAEPGVWEDRTRDTGLFHSTLNVLGFGTQFLDADLDGRIELFIANGHIDDFSRYGKPYRMPPKLFRWNGQRFLEISADELGAYFRGKWLGRAVARLDWNRDGRDDLIVGHLVDETALLTNTTPQAGGFLSLKLVGVQSSRDAVGTTASARIGQQTIVRQLTAGDGYQASNERRLIFGTGRASQIDELVVHWPSGTTQRFTAVAVPQEIWLVEGRPFVSARRERN
jgi:tetratricopeptide (TPR) repeat protein